MPYNGSGAYEAPANSWNPAVGGTAIDSADWNSLLSDLETALSSVITKDGQTTITANLPMSGFKHTGVNTNSGSTSRSEYASGATLQDGAPLDAGYTGGTDTAYTATLTPAIAAYADKQCFRVIFDQACGATPTINFNSLGAKKLYKNVGGAATQITTGDIPDNFVTDLRYDSTLDSSAGAFWVMDSTGVSAGTIGAEELAASALGLPVNLALAASVGSSALTVALKGQDGNDPSSTNPVKIPFPNQTGGYDVISVTAATSVVVSSGSTLGTANGILAKLWIVGFNDGGTFRLGIVNTQESAGIMALVPYNTYSATAEGGAGGADSAGVIYAGAAVSSKAIAILGFLEATEATAGTWATAPSKVVVFKPWMPLPGARIQTRQVTKTDVFSTTSTSYTDITGLSLSITPTSAANRVIVEAYLNYANTSAAGVHMTLLRGATEIFLGDAASSRVRASVSTTQGSSTNPMFSTQLGYMDAPASAAAVTYKFQMRAGTAGTATLNRTGQDNDTADFGRAPSSLILTEISA